MVTIKHNKVVVAPDDPNYEISSNAWNDDHDIDGLAAVATSNDYNDLNNKPTIPTGTIDGTLTSNELVYAVDGNTVGSLAVATYPSLAEVSYVKGVTSAIQSQINAKQGSLSLTTTGSSGASTLIGNTLNIPQYSGGGGAVSSVNGQTGAVTLDAGDIDPATNRNYVTDAQLTVIGNTSGTNTGDQTNITGNAGTATALQTARTIGGVSFDGTANIVPQTIQSVNEATDTTCYPLFITASGSQSLQPKNNAGLIYNSNTNALTATSFVGALTGNASTATTLQTARNINGTSFNGSADITVTAAAGTLTGSTLASGVTASSLTSVGVINSGTWQGTAPAVAYGGTGATAAPAARVNLGFTTKASNTACNSNTTFTFDRANGVWSKATFTSSCTLAFTFPSGHVDSIVFEMVNAGAYTLTFPAGIKWAGGAAPTFTSSGTDHVVIYYDGTNLFGARIAAAVA